MEDLQNLGKSAPDREKKKESIDADGACLVAQRSGRQLQGTLKGLSLLLEVAQRVFHEDGQL